MREVDVMERRISITDLQAMKRMLKFSAGRREVPTIVEGDKITVGFGGT